MNLFPGLGTLGLTSQASGGGPPPPPVDPVGLVWHFDAQDSSQMTLDISGQILTWNNISAGPTPGPSLLGVLGFSVFFEPSVQNGLGGAVIPDPGSISEMNTGTFAFPQPFTAFIVFRTTSSATLDTGPLENSANFMFSKLSSLLTNSSFGSSISTDNTNQTQLATLIADGANSLQRTQQEFVSDEVLGDVGADGLDGFTLSHGGPDGMAGAIFQIKIFAGVLDPGTITTEENALKTKWFNDFPFTLAGLDVWFDASQFLDVTTASGVVTNINDRTSQHTMTEPLIDAPTYLIQGQNGLNVFDFDGTEIITSSAVTTTAPWVFWITFKPKTPTVNDELTIFSADGPNFALLAIQNFGGPLTEYSFSDDDFTTQTNFIYPGEVWTTIIIENNGVGSVIHVNNLTPINTTMGGLNLAAIAVAGDFGGGFNKDMLYGAHGAHSGTMTGTEITNLKNYLNSKWGVV